MRTRTTARRTSSLGLRPWLGAPTAALLGMVTLATHLPAETQETRNQGFRTHTVQPGETLTEIAQDALSAAEHGALFLQVLNDLDDPSRLYVGQKLRLPESPRSLIEPLGIPVEDCVDFGSSGFDWREAPTPGRLLVGVSCWDDTPGFATRHLVLELGPGHRTLVFDSATAAPDDADLQADIDTMQSWWFVDLDGDGGADLHTEMSQGSANSTTQFVFHHRDSGYHPCLLFRETSLGDVEERRDGEGAVIFDVQARETDRDQLLAWSTLRQERCR